MQKGSRNSRARCRNPALSRRKFLASQTASIPARRIPSSSWSSSSSPIKHDHCNEFSGFQKEAEERTERRKQKLQPKLLRKFKKSEKGLVLSQDSKSVSESSEKSQFVLPKASRKSAEPPDRSQKAPGKPSKGPGVYPKTPSKSPRTPAKSGTLARKVRKAQDEAPERTKEEKPSRRATAIPRR